MSSGRRYQDALQRLQRVIFRDRIGATLFVGSLVFMLLFWRTGILINDNITLRETLAALAEGRVWIEPATGDFLQAPGTGVRDGLVYGRNYGQLVLSLPALYLLQAIDRVADLGIALTALWHLLALWFILQLGRMFAYQREAALLGSVAVLVSFLGNLSLATTLSDPSLPVLALQLTAVITAAVAAVFCYRFVTWRASRPVGILAGTGLILATPVAFWGLVPKRHVFSVAIVIGLVFAFARSRDPDATVSVPVIGPVPAYRAAAYALIGLLTWINAEEGLYAFLALVVVDFPTAPSNDRRSLAVIAVAFTLSLVPFFITNLLVTGNPLRPPRSLIGGFFGGSDAASEESTGFTASVAALLPSTVVWIIGNVTGSFAQGIRGMLDPVNMYQTFIHSSPTSIDEDLGFRGINLSVLESAPAFGGLIAAGLLGVSRLLRERVTRLDATDTFVLVLIVAYVLTKIGRLPLRVQINVRYLLPVYALGIILLARSDIVEWIRAHQNVLYWTYSGGVCIGGQLLFIIVLAGGFTVGEASRTHAFLGLGLGVMVCLLCLIGFFNDRVKPAAVGAIGFAAAAATVFTVLAGLYYFSFAGEHVLPVVEFIVTRLT